MIRTQRVRNVQRLVVNTKRTSSVSRIQMAKNHFAPLEVIQPYGALQIGPMLIIIITYHNHFYNRYNTRMQTMILLAEFALADHITVRVLTVLHYT